ncbi:MAG: RNA methyltransferase [Flavobacteriales bacterium]|nr:RNA methyltransferase [Flavobacteriales bacterium]
MSKSELKELKSLHQKKYRELKGKFLVEGDKSVQEAIKSDMAVEEVYAVDSWAGSELCSSKNIKLDFVTKRELDSICELKNPNQAVAVMQFPQRQKESISLNDGWNIFLEKIQDPGNLGTILRIADWYGIEKILCSPESVEPFNQKVIQSSMGAVFRVPLRTINTEEFISFAQVADVKLYATAMKGESIYREIAEERGILMMGNEGNGLSSELLDAADRTVTIPGHGKAESLNVAVATGILTDWISRSSSGD